MDELASTSPQPLELERQLEAVRGFLRPEPADGPPLAQDGLSALPDEARQLMAWADEAAADDPGPMVRAGHYLDGARIVAAVGVLAPLAETILGRLAIVPGAEAPLARDDQLAVEALFAYRDRMRRGGLPWPPATRDQFRAHAEAPPTCWFGTSAVDGQPWMFCMTPDFVLDLVAVLERALAACNRR